MISPQRLPVVRCSPVAALRITTETGGRKTQPMKSDSRKANLAIYPRMKAQTKYFLPDLIIILVVIIYRVLEKPRFGQLDKHPSNRATN